MAFPVRPSGFRTKSVMMWRYVSMVLWVSRRMAGGESGMKCGLIVLVGDSFF